MEVKVCGGCSEEKPLSDFPMRSDPGHTHKTRSHCRPCQRERAKGYYHKNKKPGDQRELNLRRSFGIGIKDYEEMFTSQEGCCKICGRHREEFNRNLAVDHCHDTGKIRGLLCHFCNVALGNFRDDISTLEKAIDYLKENR